MSKKNKKKIVKYVVGGVAVAAISASVIAAAVSCSSVNSSTTTSTNSQTNNTNAASTNISVTGATSSTGNSYEAPYDANITLKANNANLPSGNITYSWYVGNNLVEKQTTNSNYEVTVAENANTYYVVTYVNGVQETTSNRITIAPTFDASKFSGAIFANPNGSNNGMHQVSTINDTDGTQDYTLNYHVLYDGQLLNTTPATVTWTVNGVQSNDTGVSFTVSDLHMGVNTITASTTISIPGQSQTFTMKLATLTINVASLQISGNNVKNNSVSVNYDGSLTLSASKDSLASLTDAGISNATYQWYEIANNQSTAQPISSQTTPTLSLTNLTNNATYYLVATWQDGKTTNTLTSNQIVVTVNNVQTINPTIVCDNNSVTTPLNLGENNLNQTYKFTINQGAANSTSVNGKVTYTLTDTTNNTQVTLSNASSVALNGTYSINFNNLDLTAGDQYQLAASITVPSANGQTTTYSATNDSGLVFDINYNKLSINANQASTVSEVANTNTYDVAVGSTLTLSANTTQVYATGTASYKWETSANGTSWSKVDSNNDMVNGDTLTISNVGGNDAYYQLVETIGDITLTSNMIKVVPVASNMVSAQIYSTTSNADTLNIYSQTNAQQTLQLDLKNGTSTLSLSDLTNVSIDWYVNGKLEESSNNSLSFTNTYSVGQANVTVKVSFVLGNKEYSSVATSSNSAANITTNTFTINYYNVDIKATTNSIDYGANADQDAITFGDDTYMYASPMYQWYVNGQAFGIASATKPTYLPNEVITTDTTFQLVVTDANNTSATAIKSNIIDITVANNDNLTASISNQYGTNGQVTAYSNVTGSTPLSFTLNLDQAGKTYTGSLTNSTISTITWELNGTNYNEAVSDFGKPFTLPLDALMNGANTLKVTINLSGISNPITATYTINYTQLTISKPSAIYYDQDGTLSASITNFGNYITNPTYFWEVNNEVSSTTNSSSFQISNLTTQTTYQLVVGNGSSIASSNIKIYSDPITITPSALSDLSYDIALNGSTVNTSTTAHSLTTYTFSLSNLTDNAGAITANNTLNGSVLWTLSDSKGTIITKTDNLSSSSDWSDFAYSFADYGSYTISAKVSIGNYGATTTLAVSKHITFNLTQTVANVTVSNENNNTLNATITNSTSETYDENYNSGDLTLSASVANTASSIKGYQWMQYVGNKWTNITTNGTSQTYQVSTKTLTTDQYKVQITLQNGQTVDSTVIAIAPQFNQSEFSAQIVPMVAKTSSNYYDSSTNTFDDYSSTATSLSLDLDYDGAPIGLVPTITWSSNATNGTFNPVTLGANTITATATITLSNQWDKNSKENVSLTPTITVPNLTINFAQVDIIDNTPNVNYGQNVSLDLTSSSKSSLTTAGLTGLTYTWYEISTPDTTTGGTQVQSSSDSTLNINDIKNDGYYYVTVSGATPGNKTITLTSTTSIHVTVGSLSNFDLTGNVTCTNSSNTTEASPLQLTSSNVSSNVGTYNFNYDVTSSVTGFNPKVISGNVTYTLTNAKGTTITSSSSIAYGSTFKIDFSTLQNFVPGNYTLTVTGTLNDVNGTTIPAPSATYTINYSTLSITSSTGTVSDNTVTVPENDSSVTLTANTSDIFAGSSSSSSFTYKWYTVNDGTPTAIKNANSSTYMIPNTGITSQEYEVTVTVGNVTISSYITVIPTLNSNQISATITDNGATSLNIYSSTDANDQTLTLNIYDGKSTTPLTSSQYTDLQVVWEVNDQEVKSATNSLTLSDYAFGIGVSHVKITSLTFKVGDMVYGNSANPITLPSFTVTYYALKIDPTSTSAITFSNDSAAINYGTQIGAIGVSENATNSYITGASSYQWMVSVNGAAYKTYGASLSTFPSTLPTYNIDEPTSFELVANFGKNKVTSNPISFTVNADSMKFSASITNSDSNSSQTAYTTSEDASTSVKLSLNLEQNGSSYTTYSNLANGTLVWQVKDGANGTWQDVDGTKATPLNAALATSYSFDATISSPGTYIYRAVITLKGISTPITSSQFTFTYTYLSATINATSSTTGEITSGTTTNTYNAYYGGDVTISAMPTGFSATDNPTYTWKVNGEADSSITGDSSSFTIPFTYLTSQTYSLSISVDGQTLNDIATITITPVFKTTNFSTSISATNGGTTGGILSSKTTASDVYEYDVSTNDLSFNVYYTYGNNEKVLLSQTTGFTPSVTWSSGVTTNKGVNTFKVAMGENHVSVTAASVSIAGNNYTLVSSTSPTSLTIYNAELAITANSSIAYDTATTIGITSSSSQSLSDVFGTSTPTYTWTKNSNPMADEDVTSFTTDKLTSNTTYSLTVSYDVNGSTITLTKATSTVTVNALPTLTGTITCTSDSKSITSPLELTSSNYDATYSFNLNLTNSTWTSANTPTLTGTVTYTLKDNTTNTTIDLSTASENYGTSLSLNFNSLKLIPGQYTLSATAIINDANNKTVTTTPTTYQIYYSTATITSTTGTFNTNKTSLMVPENDSSVILKADTSNIFTGDSTYTYQWCTWSNNKPTPITTNANSSSYTIPTTGVTSQTYVVEITSGNTTIISSPLTVVPTIMGKITGTIQSQTGASPLNIYKNANATQTLTLDLYNGTTLLTASDYTDLKVTWQITNGSSTVTKNNNSLTLSDYQFSVGVSTITITSLTFEVNGTTYSISSTTNQITLSTFTVNYYALNISTTDQTTVDYGTNANGITISHTNGTYITGATKYEWYENGTPLNSTISTSIPSALPNYHVDSDTSFTLVATINNHEVTSNAIDVKVSPDSMKFTGSITTTGNKTSANVFTSSSTTPLTLSLDQNNSAFTDYSYLAGGTITWQYTTDINATSIQWTAFSKESNLDATLSSSYSYSVNFTTPGTYTIEAVITLNGISTPITSSKFTLNYIKLSANIDVTSTTSGEVTGNNGAYSAYYGGNVQLQATLTCSQTGFDLSNATYAWSTSSNSSLASTSSFTQEINFSTPTTYTVTISIHGTTITKQVVITPEFKASDFSATITSTNTGGTVLSNANGVIKEYNVTSNDLTYNLSYNGVPFSSISSVTPTITWSSNVTANGNSATCDVVMGENSITATGSLAINGQTISISEVDLTIYNAKLAIAPASSSVAYGQTTKISITSASQQSLNEVFGSANSTTTPTATQNNQAFLDAFSSGIANNVSNFGGSGQSGEDFVTNILNEWMAGWKLNNATYSDFSNWNASWYPTKIQGYTVLALSAYSNTPITPQYWDNNAGTGETMNYTIPTGTYFTWTLPYYQGGISTGSNNSTITNTPIAYSTYFDSTAGAPNPSWTTPLGLALGSLSNPTAISGGSEFTNYNGDTSHNGFIGIGYQSNTTNFTPALTFNYPKVTYTWTANNKTVATSGDTYTPTAIDQDTTYGLTVAYGINTLSATTKVDVTSLPTLTPSLTCTNDGTSVTSPINLDSNNLGTYNFNFSLSPKENLTGNITWTLEDNTTNSAITLSNSDVTYSNSSNTYQIDFASLKGFVPGNYTLTASASINDLNKKDTYSATFTINYSQVNILVNGNPVTGVYQYNVADTLPTLSIQNEIYNQTGVKNPTYTYNWEVSTNGGSTWTSVGSESTYQVATSYLTSENSYKVIVTSAGLQVASSIIQIDPILPTTEHISIVDGNNASPLSIYNASQAKQPLSIQMTPTIPSADITNETITWKVNGKQITGNIADYEFTVGQNTVSATVNFTFDGKPESYSTASDFVINYYALDISSTTSSVAYNTNANTIQISTSGSYMYSGASYQWTYSTNNGTSWKSLGSQFTTLGSTITIPSYLIDQNVEFKLTATEAGYTTLSKTISFTVNPDSEEFSASITNSSGETSQTIYDNTTPVSLSLSMKDDGTTVSDYSNLQGTITWEYSSNNGTTWTAITNEKDLPIASASSRTLTIPSDLITTAGTSYEFKAVITLNNGTTGGMNVPTSTFTLTYAKVTATIDVSSTTSGAVTKTNGVYSADYGDNITVAVNSTTFTTSDATYAWTVNGETLKVNGSDVSSASFTLPFKFATSQTYEVTIMVDGQTITESVTVDPNWIATDWKATISATANTGVTIVKQDDQNVYEYDTDGDSNTLTFNITYNGTSLSSIDSSITPSITWGVSDETGNSISYVPTAGENSISPTTSFTLSDKQTITLAPTLNIYCAQLEISPANANLDYGGSTTITISTQSSLNDVFSESVLGSAVSATYKWTANGASVSNNDTSSLNTGALTKDSNTYDLAITYTVGTKTYTLTATPTTVVVNSLASENVKATITYDGEDSLSVDSSNLNNMFNFNIAYATGTGSTIANSLLTGSVSYTVTSSTGTVITTGTSSSISEISNVNLSKIDSTGDYKLTATISLNDNNGTVDKITATFDIDCTSITSYKLAITASTNTVDYDTNANTITISKGTGFDVYPSTTYQWQINIGSGWTNIGDPSDSFPSTLPSYALITNTKFRLSATNKNDSSETIYSSPISITVTNNISATITAPGATNNTDTVYGTNTALSIQLMQNNKAFSLSSATTGTISYSWSYTTPSSTTFKTVSSATEATFNTNSFLNATSANGTYTVKVTVTLPGNVTVDSSVFTIKYTAITITNTTAYYGYSTTLSTNITGAKSYAWYSVNSSGTVSSSSIGSDATYNITGIMANQSYQLWVTGTNGQVYKSSTYIVKVNKLTSLSLSTTYNADGYAQWFANENIPWTQSSGFNDFITQYMSGYQLDPNTTYSDFTNQKFYFSSMPSDDNLAGQAFVTVQATSTAPITLYTWNNQNPGAFVSSKNIAPKGSVFTWTLPYELSQMYYSGGNVGIPFWSASNWWNSNAYKDNFPTPFGLSIGSATNPTSYSGTLSGNDNGVILIAYGDSSGSPYAPPSNLSNAYPGNNTSNPSIGSATTFANSTNATTSNNLVLTSESNSANISSNSVITFLTNATTNAGAVTTSSFTNDGNAITPTCTYTIKKGSTTIVSDASASLIGDEAMFNYLFDEPGQYTIAVTYSVPNLDGTLSQSETYYVNYNQVAITASNTNPKVGSTVTLSANNDGMHVATTDATYQWLKVTDGKATPISGAKSSTYDADIDVYNETYEYELEETIGGVTYTSAPITITPNDSELTISASISNSNAINGDIGITSSANETFNLSATFNGETYNSTTQLSGATITWYVNGTPISADNNKWSITYDATSQGTYAIKAVIAVTAYGDSDIPSATSNTITINYTSEMGTLNIDTPTSSSPYVYNKSESKLVIWGNGTNTPDTTPVGFSVTGLSATNASDYEVEFINGSKTNDVTLTNLTFSGSTGTFTLPVSDFDGYTSLKLINTKTNTPASQTIAYTYLPQKPWFEIEPGSSITVANPQITLVPNENLGSATLGAITTQDLSFSLDVNGTTIGITPVSGSSTNATISIEGASLTYDNFYTVSVNNNVSYQVNGQTITGAAYVISFDATKFKQLISYADYSGTWTTIQVNTTLSGVTLDGEPITGTNPLTQTIGYANTNNSTNDMYTAGVYWNNVPVTSVPQGASNVTLQLKGTLPSGATIQWLQVTSGGAVDLTDATNATYDLSAANLQTSGMLTYEAQITSDGNTITTNQCTVNVTDLGQATINIENQTASQVISSTDSTYDLTSGTTYQIQTSNQSGVTLNDTQSGATTYYQWQYKSNSVILDGTASNSTWTNLGNATSTYQPYSYTAVPMYSVSFRLVVFTDSSTPTTFNAQTNTQYIISNVINTYAAFNCSFDVVTSTPSVKEGTAVTYTLNPSDQQALMLLVKNCEYTYDTYDSSSSSYDNNTFYPVTVTWYYKLSSASSYTTAATLSITIDNGKLAFAGANYDSLSYTFSGSDFSTAGTYDIYAKINYTDNFNTSSSNTANLTVTGTNSSLNYNYETYMENAIANWINAGTNAVENTSLNGTQSQSTFNDFIQQNGAGYEVHATYQDFDNYKVSFTSTPSADSSELGNNEWLTITATATTTINMYYWQSSGGWGASGGTTVASGNQFVWTLPYALSDITYTSSTAGGMLEMALNSTYSNATSNEDLPVPFGLSVGTSTDPTSISKTWSYTSKTSGVLANNYGTNGESFTLPSPWVVPYNQNDAFVNLFASQLNSNATNFGNTGSSASTFITNLITGNEAGFKLPTASYSDFSNWYVTWNSTAIQGYYFLTVSAFNNTAITMDYWDNPSDDWASLESIPTGSYFTWTFPYYKSIISFDSSNGTLSNAGMPQSDYFDSNTGAPNSNWTTPLGLSIGSPTSPDSITSGTLYTTGSLVKAGDDTTHNGVIGWNYGSTTSSLTFTIPPQTTSSTTTAVLNNNSLLFTDELLTNWNK